MNSINLEPTTGIKAKKKFYKFCVKSGIDLARFDTEKINFEGKTLIRSFKHKADEVKEKYNHKFANLREENTESYPNIENLIFEPKK